MKNLVPITSLDQLKVGSIVVDKNRDCRRVLAKIDLIVYLSALNKFNQSYGWHTWEELNGYKLEVEEEKWRPQDGEKYWLIYQDDEDQEFKINSTEYDTSTDWDEDNFKARVAFRTKEEADAKLEKIKAVLAE